VSPLKQEVQALNAASTAAHENLFSLGGFIGSSNSGKFDGLKASMRVGHIGRDDINFNLISINQSQPIFAPSYTLNFTKNCFARFAAGVSGRDGLMYSQEVGYRFGSMSVSGGILAFQHSIPNSTATGGAFLSLNSHF
jgi:hypothetical protein